MSDYGFRTNDKNGKISLNAKNPMFGFDVNHKPSAFKTFHITDEKQSPIHTSSIQDPNPQPAVGTWGTGEVSDWGYEKELVKKIKHGYDFRPVGYATITGKLNTEARVQLTQTDRTGDSGGSYTKPIIKEQYSNQELSPSINGRIYFPYTGFLPYAPPVVDMLESDFSSTVFPTENVKYFFTGVYGAYNIGDDFYIPNPISVEIDDEYIYIYRTYLWSDTIRRAVFNGSFARTDLQERVQISTQFTGSVYDITVYLCPYPIEEILNG